jgi:hypothetical protein
MGNLSTTSLAAYLKERWIDTNDIMLAIVAQSPVLGMIEKKAKKVGGRYIHVPLIRVGAQGRSATYANADTNANSSETVGFNVNYTNNFQIGKVDGDAVDDSDGSENAIAEAIDLEMTAVLRNLKKDMQLQCFGNQGGARGRVGSIATGNAGANCRIVLKNPTDSKFFEEKMVLAASANDGTSSGHTLRNAGATITIVGIDKMNGYLEFASSVLVSIAALAPNDYLFADGDFKNKITGFRGWVPLADPTSGESFAGVDRSVSVLTLSGLRFDATGKPLEQAITDYFGYATHFDQNPDAVVMNPIRWSKFANSLGADRANRISQISSGGKATVSYSAIMVATGTGDKPVMSDAGCDVNEALALQWDSWFWGYSGSDLVHLIDEDGLTIRRGSGDSWKFEVKSRGNMACNQPGLNGRLTLSSIV